MGSASTVIGAVADVVTWTALAGAIGFLIAALVARIIDGDWVPVRAYIEPAAGGLVARWFSDHDGVVREIHLSRADEARVGDRDEIDAFARLGSRSRLRFDRSSHAVKGLVRVGIVLGVIAIVAFAIPWILLMLEG